MKLINAGCFPNKARPGNKNFSDENKLKVFEKVAEKYRQKRKAFDGSTQFTSTFYKVQKVRAQREGRSYSDSVEDDSQHSDEEIYHDAGEDEDEGDHEEEPDLDMNPDADRQASTPNTVETIDFRELRPTTYLQIDLISMMLEPSRLQFFYMTGATPPPRASSENYLTQYNRLQSVLNNEITKAGVEDYNGTLIGLTEFTDKKWTWNGPWCFEAFGTELQRDQVSAKILEIKQELATKDISPEVEAAEEGALEPMASGEMAIEDIESLDFLLPMSNHEGMDRQA